MKVITMESSAFTALTEQIAEIAAHVRAVSGGRKEEAPDRLLTTREAAHLLNVSCRTLQRMRSESPMSCCAASAAIGSRKSTACSKTAPLRAKPRHRNS